MSWSSTAARRRADARATLLHAPLPPGPTRGRANAATRRSIRTSGWLTVIAADERSRWRESIYACDGVDHRRLSRAVCRAGAARGAPPASRTSPIWDTCSLGADRRDVRRRGLSPTSIAARPRHRRGHARCVLSRPPNRHAARRAGTRHRGGSRGRDGEGGLSNARCGVARRLRRRCAARRASAFSSAAQSEPVQHLDIRN